MEAGQMWIAGAGRSETPVDQIIGLFGRSALGRELVEQRAAEVQQDRIAAAEALAKAEADAAAALAPLRAELEAAKAERDAARAAERAAIERAEKAHKAMQPINVRLDRSRRTHRNLLLASYSPEIDTFVHEMKQIHGRANWHLRRPRAVVLGEALGGERYSLKSRPAISATDGADWHAIFVATDSAIKRAEELKLDPFADVAAELSRLRASIPPVPAVEGEGAKAQ
jgi:hypothetical protein